jgi:hypothetical protein
MATKSAEQKREDEVLLRMLKAPPKPHAEMKVRKTKTSRGQKKKPSGKDTKVS